MSEEERKETPETEAQASQGAAPAAQQTEAGREQEDPIALAQRLEQELAELRDRHLRALADLENIHKRHVRELNEVRKKALADFATDLLEVADNLRRAIESVPREELDESDLLMNLLTGVELVERQLLQVFEKYGIRRIEPKPGEPFRHELHEAVYEVESAEHRPGVIAEVMQVGYAMGERLLRPARVGIAKLPVPVQQPQAAGGEGQTAAGGEAEQSAGPGSRVDTRA